MALRTPQSQPEHDKAVKDIAASEHYSTKLGKVVTNHGSEKNFSVDSQYPDIVLADSFTSKAKEIGEVETSDSVTESEAKNQWADYAKLGVPFDLFVPSGKYNETNELLKKFGIRVREIVLYRYVNGQLKLT